jgi:hypothetical protein
MRKKGRPTRHKQNIPASQWIDWFADWLQFQGFLGK